MLELTQIFTLHKAITSSCLLCDALHINASLESKLLALTLNSLRFWCAIINIKVSIVLRAKNKRARRDMSDVFLYSFGQSQYLWVSNKHKFSVPEIKLYEKVNKRIAKRQANEKTKIKSPSKIKHITRHSSVTLKNFAWFKSKHFFLKLVVYRRKEECNVCVRCDAISPSVFFAIQTTG